MSRRYYVETTQDGQHRFVSLKRSRSHHHHHHNHSHHHLTRRHFDDHDHDLYHHHHCYVSKEEWCDLVERERSLREANDGLARENNALKCNLEKTDAELRRHMVLVPQLQEQVRVLAEDNASLRRSIDNAGHHSEKHHREVERLKNRLRRADEEIESLRGRVADLVKRGHHSFAGRIEELNRKIKEWICKFEVVDDHNRRLRRDVDRQKCVIAEQHERLREYERILIRHGICD